MQKIQYVPPWSEFGDDTNVILELAPPYILGSISGTGGIDTTILSTSIPGVPGELVQAIHPESRVLKIPIHVQGGSRKELYANRMELARRLSPSETPGMLYYSNDHITVRIPAIPQGAPIFNGRTRNYGPAEVQFYCPNPYWEAVEETTDHLAYIDSGFEFPVDFDEPLEYGILQDRTEIYNDQPVNIPLELTILAPATNPIVLKNETTGEQITLSRALSFGEKLTISTKRGDVRVTLTHEDGTTEDAFHYIDPSSEFFSLVPGVNSLRYMTWNESEATTATIQYRILYVGV